MSYLVLARKYRPQRFDDLVGQEHVARTLKNAIALERVHHAYLFTGARGVGKTSAARILAMALLCEKGPGADPCGACRLCIEIASGQSVDVLEIDGASNTGVDDVRVLREGVKYAPAHGRRKVYIIDEVHMLSTSAFNALLKTLEEPPAHVTFVLATTEVHKIPATILSRVQRHDFKLVPTGRLVEHLGGILGREDVKFAPEALRTVAREAGGSVRDALSLLDQLLAFVGKEKLSAEHVVSVLGLGDHRVLAELCKAVLERQAGTALKLLGGAIDRGVDLTQLSRSFLGYLHDLELVGVVEGAGSVLDLTDEELTVARELAALAPAGLFSALFDRWARAIEEGSRAFAPRLIYEMALVELCQAEPLVPLGDLLGRLEALEARLGPGGPAGPEPARERQGGKGERTGETASGAGWGPPTSRVAPRAARLSPGTGDAGEPREADGSSRPAGPAPGTTPGEAARFPVSAAVLADPEALWRAVQTALESESPMLAAALEHAVVEDIGDSVLRLALADRFQLGQVESAKERIERLLERVCGRPMRMLLRAGESAAPLVPARARVEADVAAEEQQRRESEAREHPMIRRAQDLFHAGVSGVRTLGGGKTG